MINAGIAHNAVNIKKDNTLKIKWNAPVSNEVPANMLLRQFNAMGTAASPPVHTTIRAARCLDLSSSYLVMALLFFMYKK